MHVSFVSVAMTACVSSSGGSKPSGSIVKFDEVKTSVGVNNISSFRTSGKFNCEIDGLYLISAFIDTNSNYGYYHVYKNGITIGTTVFNYISSSDSIENTGTAVVTVELDIGDTVRIQTGRSMNVVSGLRSCFTIAKLN